MRSPSIERFYALINKHILLTESYSEFAGLEFIIKSCRLKPYELFVGNKKYNKIKLHNHWFDEFNNSLYIKNKKVYIKYNDLCVDKSKLICTDLYYGLGIQKVFKISKLLFIEISKDEDHNSQYCVSLLGMDNFLRTYYYNNEWEPMPSLHLGIKILKFIAKNKDIKYFKKLNIKNTAIPCLHSDSWLCCLPAHNDFFKILNHEPDNIVSFLTKD
jgi:hypothetical protein